MRNNFLFFVVLTRAKECFILQQNVHLREMLKQYWNFSRSCTTNTLEFNLSATTYPRVRYRTLFSAQVRFSTSIYIRTRCILSKGIIRYDHTRVLKAMVLGQLDLFSLFVFFFLFFLYYIKIIKYQMRILVVKYFRNRQPWL